MTSARAPVVPSSIARTDFIARTYGSWLIPATAVAFPAYDLPNPAVRGEGRRRRRHHQSPRQAQRLERPGDGRAGGRGGAHRDGSGDQGRDPDGRGPQVVRGRRGYFGPRQTGSLRREGRS